MVKKRPETIQGIKRANLVLTSFSSGFINNPNGDLEGSKFYPKPFPQFLERLGSQMRLCSNLDTINLSRTYCKYQPLCKNVLVHWKTYEQAGAVRNHRQTLLMPI